MHISTTILVLATILSIVISFPLPQHDQSQSNGQQGIMSFDEFLTSKEEFCNSDPTVQQCSESAMGFEAVSGEYQQYLSWMNQGGQERMQGQM